MIVYVAGDIEKGIIELKKKMAKNGILRELRSKQFFMSKSERRKVKDHAATLRLTQRNIMSNKVNGLKEIVKMVYRLIWIWG